MEGPFHASHGQRLAIPPNLDFTGEAKFLWNYHGWRGILQVAVPFFFSRGGCRSTTLPALGAERQTFDDRIQARARV